MIRIGVMALKSSYWRNKRLKKSYLGDKLVYSSDNGFEFPFENNSLEKNLISMGEVKDNAAGRSAM